MQSWQADFVNAVLSVSLKPALKRLGSVRAVRGGVYLGDQVLGRLATPPDIQVNAQLGDHECSMEWISAKGGDSSTAQPVMLYLPGGAYIMRTPHLHRGLVSRLCKETGGRALLCFYRLAPEHPFPAGLEDALEAYQLMLDKGIDPRQIVIVGDSAGGGLTLSLMLRLKELELPQPAGGVLMSPLLDMTEHAPSRSKNARRDTALPPASRRGINPRDLYINDTDHKNPLVSPVYGDLHGLPPCYLLVSDTEMLLDDSLRLARRAHQYRMRVKLDIWHRLPHVWVSIPLLPESGWALRRIGQFIRTLPDGGGS
jgi:epsilon-lactone hydrolase